MLRLRLMAENGNLNNNNSNFTQTTREFINRSTITTTTAINSTTTATLTFSGTHSTTTTATTNIEATTGGGLTESDATHFRLRDGVTKDFEFLTCFSCDETFKSTSLLEVYDHYRERPHLRHYANCLYCQGKVHQYYHNRLRQVKYYHNCLRWKRGEDH